MKKSKRLKRVLDLMERKEQGAARVMAGRQNEKQTLLQQMETLEEFRSNYAAGFGQAGAKGLTPGQLLDYQRFMGNINAAIGDQKKALEELEPRLEGSRKAWEAARIKAQGISKIRDQAGELERFIEDQREQLASDDKAGSKKGGSPRQ